MIRFTDVYSDNEIRAIVTDRNNERIDLGLMKSRKVGKYGIKIESSSSSPTAKYANFLSILEIARMYPEQLGAEVVIENATPANKEAILQQVKPAAGVNSEQSSVTNKGEKVKTSKDFVNIVT